MGHAPTLAAEAGSGLHGQQAHDFTVVVVSHRNEAADVEFLKHAAERCGVVQECLFDFGCY